MSGMKRSRIRYEITCAQCAVKFTVPEFRKNIAKYCSRRCLALGARTQITAQCLQCQKTFSHLSSRANLAKYCSPACFHAAMKDRGTQKYQCHHCHKEFLSSPSKKRKFCSRECVNKSSTKTWVPTFATVRKSMIARNMITKCERCGYDQHPEILGVHHKDRNRKNNALENLEVLCPICHSLEHSKHINHGFAA